MKPYIIGETAYNHEGDFKYIKRMIDDMAEVGLNAIKFHLLFDTTSYLTKGHPVKDMIQNWMFSEESWGELFDYTAAKNMDVIALCDDVESINFINDKHPHINAIEIHATGINDHFLLEASTRFNGKIILGVGGCSIDEIQYSVDFLRSYKKTDLMLMYGFQSYPTKVENINLSKMLKLRELFDIPVGYADHTSYDDTRNIDISCMASAMGIPILEKHYTPDFGLERIDFHSAVGKEHLLKIKERMEIYLAAYGTGSLEMSEPELKYGNVGPMKKAIVAKRDIKKGEKLSFDNLWFKRSESESYIRQNQFLSLIGSEALCDISQDTIVNYSNIKYSFKEVDLNVVTGGLNRR